MTPKRGVVEITDIRSAIQYRAIAYSVLERRMSGISIIRLYVYRELLVYLQFSYINSSVPHTYFYSEQQSFCISLLSVACILSTIPNLYILAAYTMTTPLPITRPLNQTISTLENIQGSNDNSDVEALPSVFRSVVKWTPPVKGVFVDYKKQLISGGLNKEDSVTFMSFALSVSLDNATQLDGIINKVVNEVSDNPNVQERYREFAEGVRLEILMKTIIKQAIELANSSTFAEVAGARLTDLRNALNEFEGMPSSLSEDSTPHSIHHSGQGSVNFNTGRGTQNNNNGTGNQFNAPIGTMHYAK